MREAMDKNRIGGGSVGRAGQGSRGPYRSRTPSVNSVVARRKRSNLSREICCTSRIRDPEGEAAQTVSASRRTSDSRATAPAHQLRLSFTALEDGEAETATFRAAKPLWRKTNRPSGPPGLNVTEPPGAHPHAGWCGRGEWAPTPPMPIRYFPSFSLCL